MLSPKDILLHFRAENVDMEAKPAKKSAPKANGHPSPMKNKTASGKVLRNTTRSAAQEEIVQSTAVKIREHQKELHSDLQVEGFARHS